MRIISKFKDYFDYYNTIYGVDNNVILDRRNYIDCTSLEKEVISNINKNLLYIKRQEFIYEFLFFCGKVYMIVDNNIICEKGSYFHSFILDSDGIFNEDKSIKSSRSLDYLHKKFNTPYFIITLYDKGFYYDGIPILKEIGGFCSLYSADMAYKTIYTYIQQKMNDNPDNRPPVELDDKYKIHKAGFDNNSFKHRK